MTLSNDDARPSQPGRLGRLRPPHFFGRFFFFFEHITTKHNDRSLAQTWQILVPDRGLLQKKVFHFSYTEMAPNAWKCLQLASIFEFFSRGRVMFVPDRSAFFVYCRIKKTFIVVTVHWNGTKYPEMLAIGFNFWIFFPRGGPWTPLPWPPHLQSRCDGPVK